jgi:hypothetical protein
MCAALWLSLVPAQAPAEGEVMVWAVPSVQKVRPDDRPETSNLVWSSRTKTISLSGAKNEHVPFQIVVSAPVPRSRHERAPSGFFVEAGDLSSAAGRIPRDRVKLYFEHVILCYAKSGPVGAAGFWPDALAPLTDAFSMAAEFRSFVRNRAVWADIVVPADAPAGTYTGMLAVTRDGKKIDELRITLTVHDFALPEETHLVTYMGMSGSHIERSHRPVDASERRQLLQKYYEFLYANRMEPWFNEPLQPAIEARGDGDVAVRFDDAVYRDYMERLKTKRVILEAEPRELRPTEKLPLFSEPFNRRIRSYVKQVADYYASRGWKSRLVFNSPIDEPATAEHYEDTRRWARLVHEAAPGVPFLVTKSPVPGRPELGTLVGHANYFSIHGNELNSPAVKKAIREEQAKGGEITWYISCDQIYPQPNYFIDAPAMDPVMVPWITWRYGMNGVLYWAVNYWSQTPDPWIDPVTFLSGFLCSDGSVLNGEGSLVYPGHHTRRYTGQKEVYGPVSSLRFELLREGIEDYEYLWLLKSLGDGAFADRAAESMVVDVSAFSRNVEELFAIREAMARRIVELKK